ncbi:uncharacterized protein PF11_0213 isoform X2 [Apis florea]|uniref:uncharacterized protein PF11_0213 isoform X2 n=1 Tax=Apis florea TaxID=7463 RepID=UPI0012FF07EA|nr:uncharacterized protein PF11_0213 isoform X2 [Apis florea]
MSQIIEIKTEKKNVATQTREIDTMLEIARLQEQVKLLTIEINHLRKYSVENSMIQTPEKNSNNILESPIDNETLQKNSQSEKIERKNSKIISRGCNCKGKCSSKICGCVKKNNQCQEWCKCNNDICQNQEHKDQNKENLKHNESYEHMENQQINKNTSHVNAHKSLFSPNITIQEVVFNVDQYKPPALYFGGPKELKFVSDEEEQKEKKNEKLKKIENKNDKKNIKNVRTRRNNFDINNSENIQRSKSISNEKKQGENNIEIKKRALRSCTSNEIQISKEFKHVKKQTNNYVQNVMNDMVTLRHKKKRAEDKNMKKTINNTDVSKEATPFSEDMKEISSNETNEILNFVGEINSHEIDICNENKSHDKDSDNDFNPMKPKHEIPRTPIHSPNQNMTISCNISDTSLVISANSTIKEQEQYQDPVEFSYAQVNWEEYQSQLVTCNKCKRKFHPLRIKKHESCCKKIMKYDFSQYAFYVKIYNMTNTFFYIYKLDRFDNKINFLQLWPI